ncbi:MAG: DNA repair protein RecN [Pseudomonadota bacterium]
MIKTLKIEQFVIIESLELDFQDGLTILTGETGAGKSILLGAMGLILGDEPNVESVRTQADQADIEAVFIPEKTHPVWDYLIKNDLAASADTEFTVHRTIRKDEQHEVLFNGKNIELEELQKVGMYLVEIHGQFANQSLLGAENQLNLLDLAGNYPPEVFANVASALAEVRKLEKELDDERTFLLQHKQKLRSIEENVRKFESIEMDDGFAEELKEEYATLLTAKETCEAFQAILSQLVSGGGVVVALSTSNLTLSTQANLDKEKMKDLEKYLSAALENARAAVNEMNRLAPEYEIDTEPLHECKRMLDVLEDISRSNNIPFEKLNDFWIDQTDRLERIKAGRERLKELEGELQEAKADYLEAARVLTEHRMQAAQKMSQEITDELPPLKLDKAEFEVIVKEDTSMEWTEKGLNKVTFTARMNPGQEFSPIADTASGGELARMILGLKVVLQRVQTTPTLVFDEVDTGIGGAAAAAVGERLAHLAENTQVMVITHSPQVASRGDKHLHVSKATDGITTTSGVSVLSTDERIDEISRMLAGDTITPEAMAAAKSLLAEASSAAQSRQQA